MLLLAVVAFGVPLALNLRDRVDAEVRSQAMSQAGVLSSASEDLLGPVDRTSLATVARQGATSVRGRVIVVDRSGRVIADSSGGAATGTSFANRPEIAAALAGRPYQRPRHSNTLSADILATATPIRHNGRISGAVRVTQSIASVNSSIRRAIGGLVLIGAVVLLLGLAAGTLIAGQVARPLRRLNLAVRRIAAGDLAARAPVEGSSEQRSLAHSFNDMTKRLAESLDAQRQFVADASHQLRTPLTGLRLRIEEAKSTGVSDSARHELDAGLGELERLATTVDELLLLSRSGERSAGLAQPIDLAGLADVAVERWQAAAGQRSVILLRGPDHEPEAVMCLEGDAERALDCLLENAVKYSSTHGEVTVRASGASVEVLDRGSGLEPGEEAAVFERFHRGRAGRSRPNGTGLGLAIARELARIWGGDVTLAPRPGGGVTATLSFQTTAAGDIGGGRDASLVA